MGNDLHGKCLPLQTAVREEEDWPGVDPGGRAAAGIERHHCQRGRKLTTRLRSQPAFCPPLLKGYEKIFSYVEKFM